MTGRLSGNCWKESGLQPPAFSAQEIEQAAGAVRLSGPAQAPALSGVSIDSRTVREGELFVAIRGRRLDGHHFVPEALANGAAGALVEQPPVGMPPGKFLWQVPDTLAALGNLARFHRDRFEIPLVAVTGSCGKTTVKEMLAHILSADRPVLSTLGTQNNLIGVPLTLFRLHRGHRAAVLELGTNQWGEIGQLTRIARPTLGVVTNIGPAHLETFGDLAGGLRAKAELWEEMDPGAMLVLNGDDPWLAKEGKRLARPVSWFGLGSEARIPVSRVECGPSGSRCRLEGGEELEVPLPGRHNLLNALAALTCAELLGVGRAAAAAALKSLPPLPGRSAVAQRDGILWIDDSYNANPASLAAGLEILSGLRDSSRKIVAVGDMLELGKESERLHEEAGRRIAALRPDLLVAVGPLARQLLEAARTSGLPHPAGRAFETAEQAGEFLGSWLRRGDAVLVKGSRLMRMERVLDGAGCFTTSSIP